MNLPVDSHGVAFVVTAVAHRVAKVLLVVVADDHVAVVVVQELAVRVLAVLLGAKLGQDTPLDEVFCTY